MNEISYSKSKIDKAGVVLARDNFEQDQYGECEKIVEWWRESHLKPLTEVTLKLIEWFHVFEAVVSVNQRLKRKPQIIKKIRRKPNMRLSQMRDIGGCRAIFDTNEQLEEAAELIRTKSKRYKYFLIIDEADYRVHGRQESGYRALHITVERNGYRIEIQLRSKLQHAWAEAIERTSVLCEKSLKEGEGPQDIIDFFKVTSDAFCEVDWKRKISDELIKKVFEKEECLRESAFVTPKMIAGGTKMNEAFMKAMVARERKRKGKIKNWVLIFDWKQGVFTHWMETDQDPEIASKIYSYQEQSFKYDEGYEVVLIGSTFVKSIKETHSHYFGVESYQEILQFIHQLIDGSREGLSVEAYYVLKKLTSHGHWGANSCSFDTLRNHYCALPNCEEALRELAERGYILFEGIKEPMSLLPAKRGEISRIVS